MCNHPSVVPHEGFRICDSCGEVMGPMLDTTILGYNEPHRQTPRTYSRQDRFMRTIGNLRGQQHIEPDEMARIPYCKTVPALRSYLKQHNRRLLPKIASVWYQMGHRTAPLTPEELKRCEHLFLSVKRKCSFLILVPWVLQQLGRPDLLRFVKPPSKGVMKKYANLLPQKTGECCGEKK